MDLPHTVCASNYTVYPGEILKYHHTCQTPEALELELSQCWESQMWLLHCPFLRLKSVPADSHACSDAPVSTV